jgi:hypothetical protein
MSKLKKFQKELRLLNPRTKKRNMRQIVINRKFDTTFDSIK